MQLSCGHVDIDRMIIQIKDFVCGGGGRGEKRREMQGYMARKEERWAGESEQ